MKNKQIKFIKRPRLKSPYLIAAWPGMGNVAARAVEFLWEDLKPVEFAEIEPDGFFHPHEAWIMNGQIELPRSPTGKFYYWKNPKGKHDLIIFLCEAQPSFEKGYQYASLVIDVAKAFKTKRVFTFASMPTPIDHTQESRVWATYTDKRIAKEIARLDINAMKVGQISGLNGLLLSVAKEKNIEGVCFLGEIPLYAIQIENPKASKAVLNAFTDMTGLQFDFVGLDERARIVEDEIEKLVDYFKGGVAPGPISEDDIANIKKSLASVTKLPDSAKAKIEQLFKSAEKDISRAQELKSELDKWHIYKDYEDRFLDLFKPGKSDNN